jgi:hypothetical protein
MADEAKDVQREFDWPRAEQLRILRDCLLPGKVKDTAGKGVRASVLKAVLYAIDHHGRGRAGGCFASIATLAKAANIGKRTCTRAIEGLTIIGLICVTNDAPRYGMLGSPTNRYTIVWSELSVLAEWRLRATDQSATGTDQSATGTDQSATGTDQSATGTRPERHGGAQNVFETSLKRRLNVKTRRDEDGAKDFTDEDLAAVREKANTINEWIAAKEPDDRELVLKIATLWHDRELADDWILQVLESFERKREDGIKIDRPCGWLWDCLQNQLTPHGLRLERLLARTRWPEQLIATPIHRGGARMTADGDLELIYTAPRNT